MNKRKSHREEEPKKMDINENGKFKVLAIFRVFKVVIANDGGKWDYRKPVVFREGINGKQMRT